MNCNLGNEDVFDKILIDAYLIDILKYLNIRELALVRSVASLFKKLVDGDDRGFFENIQINSKINLDWIVRKVKTNAVKKINFLLCEEIYPMKIILDNLDCESVTGLKLPVQFFTREDNLVKFTNLKKISLCNMSFSEVNLSEHLLMMKNILNLKNLDSLKMNNIKYLNANFLSDLTNKFRKLDFVESADFVIEDMQQFLVTQSGSLKVLRLDGEKSNESSLIDSIKILGQLSELYIAYCQNFSPSIMLHISHNMLNLTKLTLRKLRITREACEDFFKNLQMDKLEKLDFYDCKAITNVCLKNLSDRAMNLEYLELSWSSETNNESIINILTNCNRLQFLYVQGCKYLNDDIFETFYDKNKSIHALNTSTKLIDFSECDMVEDKILFKLMKIYPQLSFINYYGVNLKYEK